MDILSRLGHALHAFDYSHVLPGLARLPLPLGYRLARIRGEISARMERDWRSMALSKQGMRQHIARRSREAYAQLFPQADEVRLRALSRERFRSEAQEEYEGALIIARRVPQLSVEFDDFPNKSRDRGMVFLTAHFASFVLGYSFLGRKGMVINGMATAGVRHPDVPESVSRHFEFKYQGLDEVLNGGRILYFESGLRPFYRALTRGDCLVAQADSPAAPDEAGLNVRFLGGDRRLASGALRIAQATDSLLCSFVCQSEGPGRYRIRFSAAGPARDPQVVAGAYGFLSDAIMGQPGQWWAADLLSAMPFATD